MTTRFRALAVLLSLVPPAMASPAANARCANPPCTGDPPPRTVPDYQYIPSRTCWLVPSEQQPRSRAAVDLALFVVGIDHGTVNNEGISDATAERLVRNIRADWDYLPNTIIAMVGIDPIPGEDQTDGANSIKESLFTAGGFASPADFTVVRDHEGSTLYEYGLILGSNWESVGERHYWIAPNEDSVPNRKGLYVVTVRNKASGYKFNIYLTHMPAKKAAYQTTALAAIREQMQKLEVDPELGTPLFVGDMNFSSESPRYTEARKTWSMLNQSNACQAGPGGPSHSETMFPAPDQNIDAWSACGKGKWKWKFTPVRVSYTTNRDRGAGGDPLDPNDPNRGIVVDGCGHGVTGISFVKQPVSADTTADCGP